MSFDGSVIDADDAVPPVGKKRRALKSPRSKKLEKKLERLTKPIARSNVVQPLNVETLRPLIDLAHYSTFVEVRRDCAAAFATLSQNADNAVILRDCGIVSALIALAKEVKDAETLTDALCAIKNLCTDKSVKESLLKSDEVKSSLYRLSLSLKADVKRSALGVLYVFAEGAGSLSLMTSECFKVLLRCLGDKDEKSRRRAARILYRMSLCRGSKALIGTVGYLRFIGRVLIDSRDSVLKEELLQFVLSLVSMHPMEDPGESRENLVASGALVPILFHLDLTLCSLQTAAVVGLILENLASASSLLPQLLDIGTAGTLMTCVFEDLPILAEPSGSSAIGPVRRTNQGRHDSMSPPPLASSGLPGGANDGKAGKSLKNKGVTGKQGKTKDPVAAHVASLHESNAALAEHASVARVTLIRAALSVLRSFCAVEANKNILLEWGLVQQLIDGKFHVYDDRKTRRIVSDILKHMAATEDGKGGPRQALMISMGIADVIEILITSEDYELKCNAVAIAASLSESPKECASALARLQIVHCMHKLSTLDDQETITQIAKFCEGVATNERNVQVLLNAGMLHVLLDLTRPSRLGGMTIKRQALRSLEVLAPYPNAQHSIGESRKIGYILAASKSFDVEQMKSALSVLQYVKEDAAAIKLQHVFRVHLRRKRVQEHLADAGATKEGTAAAAAALISATAAKQQVGSRNMLLKL